MLQILRSPETTTETARPALRPRLVRRVIITTVAKARHSPTSVRSDFAARWLVGALTLKPTLTLAAHIFRVHASRIKTTLARLEATTIAEPAIDRAWTDAKPAARTAFVKAHLPEIWRLIDA